MLSVSELEVLYHDTIKEIDSIVECRPLLYELKLLLTESYSSMIEYYRSSSLEYSIDRLNELKGDVMDIIDVISFNIHGFKESINYESLYKCSTDYYIKIDILRKMLSK